MIIFGLDVKAANGVNPGVAKLADKTNQELIEVTLSGERVFHARIEAPDDPIEKGWNGFRLEYLAPDLADRLTGKG